jgi:hypothetical protein
MRVKERFVIVTNIVHNFLGSPWYTTILKIVFFVRSTIVCMVCVQLCFFLCQEEKGGKARHVRDLDGM